MLAILALLISCSFLTGQNASKAVPPPGVSKALSPSQTLGDDKTNWEEMWKTMNASGMARTDDSNLTVFDTILRVNAKQRGSGIGRTDTNVFLYEGDIVVKKSDIVNISQGTQGSSRGKRAVMRDRGRDLWPRNVPYVLGRNLGSRARSVIASAIKEWETALPCRGSWIDVTYRRKPRSYIHFFAGGGCYSAVGRVGRPQRVSIGRGCEQHGIAVHEIGHAMGLWHEQSRPDRDKFVRIIWNNIIPAMQFNFQKQTRASVDSLGESYDYDSVMHYGERAFARSAGLITIASRGRRRKLGQRRGLSDSDKKQVQKLYKCATTGCRDKEKSSKCESWEKQGYCKQGQKYHDFMQKNCCKTCNSGCRDIRKSRDCRSWKRLGYCKRLYHDFMQKNCCKTCKTACVDKDKRCSSWASRYCKDKQFGDYMKINCARSCGCI